MPIQPIRMPPDSCFSRMKLMRSSEAPPNRPPALSKAHPSQQALCKPSLHFARLRLLSYLTSVSTRPLGVTVTSRTVFGISAMLVRPFGQRTHNRIGASSAANTGTELS
jgi:hypothetical protein